MIIGISGKKQSGKDTICNVIKYLTWFHKAYKPFIEQDNLTYKTACQEQYELMLEEDYLMDLYWKKKSFAGKLKECVALLIDCDIEQFEDEKFKNSEINWINHPDGRRFTVRELLQRFGTEVGRSIDRDIWSKSLTKEYIPVSSYPEYGITTEGDRVPISWNAVYPNWIVTDVRFPSEAHALRECNALLIRVNSNWSKPDNHESETALDNYEHFDYIVENDGTLEDLIVKVEAILLKEGLL